jgi:hypothetical protein
MAGAGFRRRPSETATNMAAHIANRRMMFMICSHSSGQPGVGPAPQPLLAGERPAADGRRPPRHQLGVSAGGSNVKGHPQQRDIEDEKKCISHDNPLD